jgi:hypothetical protein
MAYYALAYGACAVTLVWAVMAGRSNRARWNGRRPQRTEPISLPLVGCAAAEERFSVDLMRLGAELRDGCGDRTEVRR